jgi:hypothetical protein
MVLKQVVPIQRKCVFEARGIEKLKSGQRLPPQWFDSLSMKHTVSRLG